MSEQIKMFIGNEEVVSDNEFTINEEMLSASSTILNNCYPKSWELTKDYVSNFYYPKDYSKFILGKGNFAYGTEEYSVLNVSGNNFIQFTTNVEKEFAGFTVYGNTTQETRSGKNILPSLNTTRTINGITFTKNNDGSITINGTATANAVYPINVDSLSNSMSVSVDTDKTYYLSAKGKTSNIIVQAYYYGTYIDAPTAFKPSYNKIGVYVMILQGRTINNVTIYPQIQEGTKATDYEQYGAMPSPDFPSELVSVGYENLINTLGYHNAGYSETINGLTITYENNGSIRVNGTATANTTYILYQGSNLLEAGKYTFSGSIGGSKSTYRLEAAVTPSYLYFHSLNGSETLNLSSQQTLWRVYLIIQNGTQLSNKIFYPMLVKGAQTHSYIPYGKYGIEVISTKEILLDKLWEQKSFNYLTGELGTSTTTNIIRSGAYEVKPNTQYTFKCNANLGEIAVFYYQEDKTTVIQGLNGYTNNKYWSFKTPSNAYYVYIRIGSSTSPKSATTNYEQKLEENNVFLYTLNQPLRSIGDTKDLLYIKNGMLYVERKIGSVVLNGSENWYVYGQTYRINNFGAKPFSSFSTDNVLAYSNYFKWLNGNSSTFVEGAMWYILSGNELCLQKDQNPTSTTLVAFKTWLSTHNTEVIYAIQNSTIEELGTIETPYSYQGDNIIEIDTGINTTNEIDYYWKNYDILFAGIVKNSGDISLNPRYPHYCSLQVLDYKTFLSESDTLDFVISNKTIKEAIEMVVGAISNYNFIVGNIDIERADDIIGAYSTLNKTAYDVFQYLADISGSRWRARYIDSSSMAIDFYDPDNLPQGKDIEYTKQYWEDENIVDLTFNFGTRDYRNKQVILSDEVFGGIDYTEVILSNGYNTTYITQENIGIVKEITVNGEAKDFITQEEKELGADAEFYYTPGKNIVESASSYTAGTQIGVVYTPLVKGRQIVYNDEEVSRIAQQTNTIGVIARYENRNDILSSMELDQIGKTYIKYKGKSEVILTLTTQNNDLYNIGEVVYFNAPIPDLKQNYMVKSKKIEYVVIKDVVNLFYIYELTSSFNSEKEINYFDNQRNKMQGNIQEGESITRNIDINSLATIIWGNLNISEVSVSVDGSNVLNSALNSPFIE